MAGPQTLIIGAGIAGSATAIELARGGMTPLILEKQRETGDAICGGFLSWQSLAALERLGLSTDLLGGNRIGRVRLFAGQRAITAPLPAPGMGLSRRRLDTLLLAAAQAVGAGVERGVAGKSLSNGQLATSDGGSISSPAIILASGKSNMAGQLRSPPGSAAHDPVVGLRLRISATPRLAAIIGDAVELFLFDRGYAGLVLQEDGSANLCLAVHKSRLSQAGGRPEELIAAWGKEQLLLGARLAAGPQAGGIDAIAAVPYGWMAGRGEAGLWRLGDQAAVIPSLAGEGMGIALASAASAAKALLTGQSALEWQPRLAGRLKRPMRLARTAWAVAESRHFNQTALSLLRLVPSLIPWLAAATRVPAESPHDG